MRCYQCPYIDQEELAYTLTYYKEEEDPIMECWCDKTGGKLLHTGVCSDALQDAPPPLFAAKKKVRTKRERDRKRKEQLKRIYEATSDRFECAVYPVDKHGNYTDNKDEIAYYKRNYIHSKYLKNQCNRAVRRYKGDLPKGGSYKKIFYYWDWY